MKTGFRVVFFDAHRYDRESFERANTGFTLDGLVGFDLHGKTAGVVGTGKIGRAMARILRGFGCEVLAFDLIAQMKRGAFLINTGRGGLVDTSALIDGLKSGHIGAAGLDVYEEEAKVFFQDWSDRGIQDDVLARLLTFPNGVITSHQAFLTREALRNIAETTLQSLTDFADGRPLRHTV